MKFRLHTLCNSGPFFKEQYNEKAEHSGTKLTLQAHYKHYTAKYIGDMKLQCHLLIHFAEVGPCNLEEF